VTTIHQMRMSPDEAEQFQEFLMESCGLWFDARRLHELERAVAGRMIALGHGSFEEYYHFLTVHREGREELNKLVLSLTVGETQFFRTPDQFAALEHYILPRLIEARAGTSRRLRVLSAGCATGEEAYSLVMSFYRIAPAPQTWDFQVQACDLNRDFLERAAAGLYSERKLRLVPAEEVRKYFKAEGPRLRVGPELRRHVEFLHFNLSEEDYSPLAWGEIFDLIFCRNVLIYFRQEGIQRVVRRLQEILADDGYLVLGYSETLFRISEDFSSVHTPETFFYTKAKEPQHPQVKNLPHLHRPLEREDLLEALGSQPFPAAPAPAPPAGAEVSPPPVPAPIPDESGLWKEGMKAFAAEQFEAARERFEEMLKLYPRSARAHLGLGLLYANQGAEQASREHCERARSLDDLLPELYFLLALLDEKSELLEAAVENYQRVLLLEPDFAMARFNLANLHQRLDRPRDARREFGNTLAILERDPENASLKFSGGLSRQALIQICEIHRSQVGLVRTSRA